ncbi:hypothetical protein ES332_A09G002500v1 [Gossypium tomentosum]|uniref:Uncharacterized protein n=1 Tax=Gossypium tomentosum TaxID=34277 RepID=A0A5D2NXC3_GOSTO|nr:hypothetical protein ES332_A09G002500v1 [Gossypium tomentosum]
MPWLITWVFNDILTIEDKNGGLPSSPRRLMADCLNDCNLFDLGFKGRCFTCSNLRELSQLIQERLDYAFDNNQWKLMFPKASVIHLPYFPGIVDNFWNDTTNPLVNTIRDFTSFLRDWNRISFGNVFSKKNKILACINGVQRALANDPNEFLIKLQQTLAKDYMDILKQEEDLWLVKKRLNC